ncbi:MAG: hypothetical protein ACFE9L_11725 [Candidatus Hodarchaeota archaeon]
MLKDHPVLFKRAISSILSFLNYSKYKNQSKNEKTNVNVNDQLRALLHFSYIYATSLTEIMSREEAINYYQTFTDQNTRNNRDPSKYVDSLENFMQDAHQFFETCQRHNSIEVIFNEGNRGIKNIKSK